MNFKKIVQGLDSQTAKIAFGIPGSGHTLSLIDEMEKIGMPFHLTHFEGSAALMAATIGHLNGKPGISMSIKGPGVTNAVPGIATAWFESYPLIHIAEATAINAPFSQAHKRLRHENVVCDISKGLVRLSDKEDQDIEKASLMALTEEPGPVLLELTKGDNPIEFTKQSYVDSIDNDRVLDIVDKSKRPILIVGSMGMRKRVGHFFSKLKIPVFSTASAKGILDENMEHSAGVYTGVGGEFTPEYHVLKETDLIIGIGLSAKEVLAVKSFTCKSVNIANIETLGTDGFMFDAIANLNILEAVIQSLLCKAWGIDLLQKIKLELELRMCNDFLPGIIYSITEKFFKGNARIVLDTGSFCTIGEHMFHVRKNDLFLLSGHGRYMGAGLPMAIGAAIYDQTVPTVVFLGDGGVGMYLAEIKLAVKNKLPLLIILMTDNAFGSIRTRAIKDNITQAPLMMDGKSWIGIFEAFGVSASRVSSVESFYEALSDWNFLKGAHFIEIPFNQEKYEAMVHGIR